MTDGFRVFYQGLLTAAHAFAQQATNYESIMPDGGFGCPRGGDDEIDRIMNLFVIALGNVHSAIANTIENHGWKLQETHDDYHLGESNVVAGILRVAYEQGYPLESNPSAGTGGSTFVPYPTPGGKTILPHPLSVPRYLADTPPQWADLRYPSFETLGGAGSPSQDPWIGGDLRGMWDLAEKLRTFAYQSGHSGPGNGSVVEPGTVVGELTMSVRKLLTEAGQEWSGTAATNFGRAYANDAAMATVVANAAWDTADALIGLVWMLYEFQSQLEEYAQLFVDRGYRIVFDPGADDSNPFQFVATSAVTKAWDWHSARDELGQLYHDLRSRARANRKNAAKTLSHQYEILAGILQSLHDDNDGRVHTPNMNDRQWESLNDNMRKLESMQKSPDYKKAGSGLGLDWVGGGKAALSVAASHGKWKDVAAPIASIILAFITAA
ncbi:DUF6317 family protein [Streptomyces sp. HPF1205]|uniref:DUF6317 family protein n=1 Tax=Streptomyces sp. HPF1205 TaxID=2873262 RepID=UPI001CEDC6DA|nr:DUF6317 family protein [Streptomyces sp. HPF1205]